MQPMSRLLGKVPSPKLVTPAAFAALFDDFDFDGAATEDEMRSFLQAAVTCMQSSNKSLDRVTAMFKLADLLAMKSSPIFPKLNVRIVLFQLILRVLKPERVNQIKFGLCGPAHFTILLIKSKPLLYVSLAILLLTEGRAKGDDGYDIVPDDYVRNFSPEKSIPEADWLIAATFRNAKTPIPPGKDFGQYGGSKAPDVFSYFLHAGYNKVISLGCSESSADWLASQVAGKYFEQYHPAGIKNDIPTEFGSPFNPISNIRIAAKMRKEGWRMLLKVNEDWARVTIEKSWIEKAQQGDAFAKRTVANRREEVLDSLKPKSMFGGLVSAPNVNHWVMAKKINIDDRGEIEAVLYTWGKQYRPIKVPLEAFVKAYSGFVAAQG